VLLPHESATMGILTIFVNAGSPGKLLNRQAILILHSKELQVLVWLTHTTEVAAFQSRVRKEKESGLMFGLEGGAGADIMGIAA